MVLEEVRGRRHLERQYRRAPTAAVCLLASFVRVPEVHLVRQLVDVSACLGRKVDGEFLAYLEHPANNALGKVSTAKALRHRRGNVAPKIVAYLTMNALVAEHDETAPRGNDEEEHAVAGVRLGHPQSHKCLVRLPANISPEQRSNRNADFSRRLLFRSANRILDSPRIDRFQELFCSPNHRFARSPGATGSSATGATSASGETSSATASPSTEASATSSAPREDGGEKEE